MNTGRAKKGKAGLVRNMLLLALLAASPGLAKASPTAASHQATARIVVTLDLPVQAAFPPAPSGRMSYFPRNPETLRRLADAQASRLAADLDLVIEEQWPIHALDVNCVVYRLKNPEQREAVIRRLKHVAYVDAVQSLNLFAGQASVDSGSKQAKGFEASDDTKRGAGISIAVIDTGADLAHEALAQSSITSHDLVDDGESGGSLPAEKHGTAILGLLLATPGSGPGIHGLVPAANVSLFRACWEEPQDNAAVCNTFTLAKALAAVLESDAQVVNLSISGPRDRLLERIAALLVDDGKTLVAAGASRAGFPGSVAGSILAAEWSGSGEAVLTALPGNRYAFKSGTSIDAARVSAAVAWLKQEDRDITGEILASRVMKIASEAAAADSSQDSVPLN